MTDFYDNPRYDFVEENRLREDRRQLSLQGVWRNRVDGCPHYIPPTNGEKPLCERSQQSCLLFVGEPCEVFGEVIEEWIQELEASGQMLGG
jgi:hypothetical protein